MKSNLFLVLSLICFFCCQKNLVLSKKDIPERAIYIPAKDIYYISEVPSKLLLSDITAIAFISILLSIIATIYPSIKASNTSPAEALKHD